MTYQNLYLFLSMRYVKIVIQSLKNCMFTLKKELSHSLISLIMLFSNFVYRLNLSKSICFDDLE